MKGGPIRSFLREDGVVHEARRFGDYVHTGCGGSIRAVETEQGVNCLACLANTDPVRFLSIGEIISMNSVKDLGEMEDELLAEGME